MNDNDNIAMRVEELEKSVKSMQSDIKDLVEAWRTANAVVGVFKWLFVLGASVAGAYNFFFKFK